MRWIVRIAVGILAVAVIVTAAGWHFVRRSLPEYDGIFAVQGIDSPVEIVRTIAAIPHIFAANDRDVFLDSDMLMRKTGSGKWRCFAEPQRGACRN